jgi:hypothetical protein
VDLRVKVSVVVLLYFLHVTVFMDIIRLFYLQAFFSSGFELMKNRRSSRVAVTGDVD